MEVCGRIDTLRELVTVRRVAASVPFWILLLVAMLALAAGLAWASELGDAPIGLTTPTNLTATASSTPSPTLTPTPMLDQHSCDQIRDTKYRSVSEREWFLNRCVTPTASSNPSAEARISQPASVASARGKDWSALVCTYDWDCSWAMAVLACESGGDPNAYNPAGPYVGLFQILDTSLSLFDPRMNIAEAYYKYQSQGPGAWGCP